MSKSLGNILTIRELSQKYDGSVIRHFLLSAHYRSPLNYSYIKWNNLSKAWKP